VHLIEKPETVAQRDGRLLLVLDTHVDEALKLEGLAREVVSRIQQKRKALELDYAQRISVQYTAPLQLAEAISAHSAYIQGETLATQLSRAEALPPPAHPERTEDADILGMAFSFAVDW
jgi:isoleucyl-tRNA synthetase